MVQGKMIQIYEDHCIYSDSHWFSFILWIILIFPLSQINRHRPQSCPCRQQSLRIIKNHWELLRINENHFQTYLTITKNQWESLRIAKNHWELLKINENQFQTYLRIIKNHWESVSDLFENHQESMRISFRLIWESLRIIKNHWESIPDLFENHQEPLRIAENQF